MQHMDSVQVQPQWELQRMSVDMRFSMQEDTQLLTALERAGSGGTSWSDQAIDCVRSVLSTASLQQMIDTSESLAFSLAVLP
jgi:hypothetical protein